MKKLALKPPVRLGPNSKILDIGSGNNCLDIATHLMDLLPEQNSERAGDLERTQGKEFRAGSIEAIPFPDRFFDFVQASHVLEHVENPARAMTELQRVAPAGYIETPAATTEQGFVFPDGEVGWSFHRWYVWTFPDMAKLYFKPKTRANYFDYCSCECGRAFARLLKAAKLQTIDPFLPYYCKMTQFNWTGKIDFSIWTDSQQGSPDARHGCDCMYSAFHAQTRRYFRSLPQLRRRWQFKSRSPEAYELVRKMTTPDRITPS